MPLAPRAVRLTPACTPAAGTPAEERQLIPVLAALLERHAVQPGDVASAGALARDLGEVVTPPGSGATRELWEALATLGAADLTLARVVEPHLDALAILDQARAPVATDRLWGVYAAEGPPPRLVATETSDGWRLSGRKHWCSLAGVVDAALVTAWLDASHRALFSVDLADPGVSPVPGQEWVARGLPAVTSTGLDLRDVPATAVGGPDWYLTRPGFAWGGMGVAAVWYGAAVGVARRLVQQSRTREPDQVALVHLGAVDAALHAARSLLLEAAREIDAGRAQGATGGRWALRVRQVVRASAEEVLRRADHALGPGPLTAEPDHAARVADLHLYLRQEHAERDQAALGRTLLEGAEDPW